MPPPLPQRMRVVVVGTSGAGKSTFARALATAVGLNYIELDQLWWGPDWTTREREPFRAAVQAATEGERWVVDGNYGAVRPIVWPRATHVVWLNYSRVTVFSRVLWRTIRRAASQEALWAGNRESFRKAFFSKDSILLWSLSTFAKNRRQYQTLRADPAYQHLQWLEFRSPRDAAAYLQRLQAKP